MGRRKAETAETADREERETVPLVLPVSMRETLRKVAAVRTVQGKRTGNGRPYSASAVAREALAQHVADWQAEVRKAGIRGLE